ncbi:MAG: [FeFe] hydrogenase H-cluster maturation GTPase HydF [Eubacteriales bacterium]|nr:[FeFe] hydrogenase H-cluster maturation GTPase HydF [Eubacteriales bacterium]
MSLNETPRANRVHIGFFGKRNAGKSSVVNAITGQSLAIVSDVKGTTTDPVYKSMELLPIGPVVIIDTPGIDDEGSLGKMRVSKTKQVLNKTDVAVLIIDSSIGITKEDEELIDIFKAKDINYIVVYNKADLSDLKVTEENSIAVSAENGTNIHELKELIGKLATLNENNKKLLSDLVSPGDFVVFITPIDEAAPKGRIILPQQQAVRDALDAGATAIVVRDSEYADTLKSLGKSPSLVVTDSQVFPFADKETPKEIPLTSFSILMSRYKGQLSTAVNGAKGIENIKDGDVILISEGCTHHRQCADIGTVKLPAWIKKHTGKEPIFEFTSGGDFPEDLSKYSLIVHCGGCMLPEREMAFRQKMSEDYNVPFTNYGILIAYMNGILDRSIEMLDL